jgi:hypothetical protein
MLPILYALGNGVAWYTTESALLKEDERFTVWSERKYYVLHAG